MRISECLRTVGLSTPCGRTCTLPRAAGPGSVRSTLEAPGSLWGGRGGSGESGIRSPRQAGWAGLFAQARVGVLPISLPHLSFLWS